MPSKAEKKVKASSPVVEVKPVETVVVPTPEVVSVPAPEVVLVETPLQPEAVATAPETQTKSVESSFESLGEQLTAAIDLLRKVNTEYRLLQKQYLKERKTQNKKVKKAPTNKISGFAKPGFISGELCDFLNVPHNTELARTDVTKKVTQYIKENNLQDPANKRVIVLDAKLKALLQPLEGQEVTYFNLQSFMKRHYEKTA
jgi:chromatin remodeling complex protein RSC6